MMRIYGYAKVTMEKCPLGLGCGWPTKIPTIHQAPATQNPIVIICLANNNQLHVWEQSEEITLNAWSLSNRESRSRSHT